MKTDYDFRLWAVANTAVKMGDPEKRIVGRRVLSRSQERVGFRKLAEAELAELGIIS